ncbi:uncharacterized protein F4807DRAFT_455335 [Annulohypoxylon truncatum]|uniref:uncharacterized protein n=1 Tax=Annulohypoxylon truncatum TaxID=327061 RepID=UPI002008EA74|nr:uncharacterized protein F4807DRAFT_455335 [Annulohypoxylon truncatum]KAI1214883.1 hypothetical protein F4807DRAFT_455335 [Annulohypoxylon truncatum]
MPPHQNKTNFRTYESSVRLLAAVLASAKPKLNYAELAEYMGGGTTASAVDHRLRPVKQLAKMQIACRKAKEDPGKLPVETQEIQKLFGESTVGGVEWQFREIKAVGRAQQQALEEGKNPAEVKIGPGKPKLSTTPPSTAKKAGAGGTPGSKRKRGGKKVNMSDEDTGGGDDSDYDVKDVKSEEEESKTPAPKRRNTATKASATKAKATPASKKNGNDKDTTTANGGVARNLFPASGGRQSTNGDSLFGKGIQRVPTKTNVQVIVDSDSGEDDETATGRQNPQRSCRVKEEAKEPGEEEHVDTPAFNSYESSTQDVPDDLSDGEI